jgi:non-ribosomal peptide synthetase component F
MEHLLTNLLSRSAAQGPGNDAICVGDTAMTYDELEKATNRVARALRTAGVRRGDRVGIFVHKSAASVVSVFGIMKAGAAYVPLDPNAPVKRLAYITRDCDAKAVLTATDKLGNLAEFFREGTPIETVILTDEQPEAGCGLPEGIRVIGWETIREEDAGPVPACGLIDTDLAYILYTSGSTGSPKGVMINHRTILTFVNWSCERFALTANDRVTSHAPLHFDLSTFDLYATVKAGATIVPVPEGLSALPAKLAAFLQNRRSVGSNAVGAP